MTPHPTSLRSATFSRKGRRILDSTFAEQCSIFVLMEPTDEWLRSRAKAMRRAPVLYERRMWALLRGRHLEGLKFQRQKVIGRYIVDFVCFRHRLIVEADGPQHDDPEADAARDAWLTAQGFRILRFPNRQIENRSHEVIAAIRAASAPQS